MLSLTWLAYPILSLLFVAFRLQLSASSAQDSVASAKNDFISSCNAAQKAATSAASMPRYLAVAANDQIADAVNGTLDAARATMVLALTIMEAIINFIIDMYRSTFLCFLELVVRGGLSLLIGAVQEINSFLTGTFSTIRTAIQNDVSNANSVITKAVDEINKINPFGNISVPQFSIPSLSDLENVTLPTDFETALIKLNASLPTLSTLKSEIDSIVDTPFELLKKEINDTFANLTFDSSVLPVPQQNTLTFCDNLDTSFIDDLGQDLLKIAKIGIIILVLLALLLLGANCVFEWYKWHLLKKHLQNTRDAWTSDPAVYHESMTKTTPTVDLSDHNLMILQADAQHPHLMKIANAIAALFRMGPSKYVNLRWFLHYVFHPPALACFLIGFFGLLSVEIQVIAVRPLADKFSQQAVASVDSYSDLIATSINGSMYNQSATYANDVNSRVDAIQATINDGVFGWVNGTTTTLNNTLNTFYNDLQNAVTTVFNGTILEEPVQEFIRCFIGSKVNDLEEALTFLHNNLQVNIPRVNETALVLSPADVNEVTTPIATAAIGGGDGNDKGVVGDLINAYIKSLKAERIMFGIFMGLWGVVVLMALCIIFWYSYGRGWVEAYRRRKWKKEQRAGVDGLVVPFRDRDAPGGGILSRGNSLGGQTMVHPDTSSKHNVSAFDDEKLAPPQHPLYSRTPAYERSWDSFLDHASAESEENAGPLRISRPMKLMALGRRVTRRETRVPDEEKLARTPGDGEVDERQRPNLFDRVRGVFWKHGDDEEDGEEPAGEKAQMREKAKPPLTIDISHASLKAHDEAGPDNSLQEPAPVSAWSVSPGPPPKLPWMPAIRPTKKVGLPPHPPLHPKSRRPAASDSEAVPVPLPAPLPQIPVAIPLYHGFEQPPTTPPTRTEWLVPPMHPTRQATLDPDTSTPVTRLLTTTHARQSSQAVDPFATPFDDEHQAMSPTSPADPFTVRAKRSTNPFAAMAF